MVDLPKKKVGIIACSGEEIPEGTISRVAARMVLEELSPENTVTLCLPLFLAGDENERAFARFYPTIAVDGCEKLCAKRATERYSGPVSGSIVVDELLEERGLSPGRSRRELDEEGQRSAEVIAEEIADQVGRLLGRKRTIEAVPVVTATAPATAGGTCCGPGVPVTQVRIGGAPVGLVALEPIFEQFCEQGRLDGAGLGEELLKTVKLYNYVPDAAEELHKAAILEEYRKFCRGKGK
ncbi:MAG TPA: putative zinc-binding protein [Anaerolineae bacterium]|nr:putative zinc-binding protein [Anaerolineae bacterium]